VIVVVFAFRYAGTEICVIKRLCGSGVEDIRLPDEGNHISKLRVTNKIIF